MSETREKKLPRRVVCHATCTVSVYVTVYEKISEFFVKFHVPYKATLTILLLEAKYAVSELDAKTAVSNGI
jgi:hypothetical protein